MELTGSRKQEGGPLEMNILYIDSVFLLKVQKGKLENLLPFFLPEEKKVSLYRWLNGYAKYNERKKLEKIEWHAEKVKKIQWIIRKNLAAKRGRVPRPELWAGSPDSWKKWLQDEAGEEEPLSIIAATKDLKELERTIKELMPSQECRVTTKISPKDKIDVLILSKDESRFPPHLDKDWREFVKWLKENTRTQRIERGITHNRLGSRMEERLKERQAFLKARYYK